MSMSKAFEKRLLAVLPGIVECFGTPCRVFDEQGMIDTGEDLKLNFQDPLFGFQEFFAVKAWPNYPAIGRIMHQVLGFGFDCSSPSELMSMRWAGVPASHLMLTSNNTSDELLRLALAEGGCILNLDDITMIDRVSKFPELICFRYNPGKRRSGGEFIGNPVEAKYGVRYDQIVEAYKRAIDRGARLFGLHTMIISNELNYRYMVETVRMLLEVMEMVSDKLNIQFEFFNIGGGIGIPYRPKDKPFNIAGLAREAKKLLYQFQQKHNYTPQLFMECGRLMSGPHGVNIARVINRMSKYREYVGVDTCTMAANPRPAIYETAYHHITVFNPEGKAKKGEEEAVDVVGSLCENNDKFARQRLLPKVEIGDIIVQHDTGAHSPGMCSNYNGWLRIQELLLRPDGSVELIRRPETVKDLFATLSFEPKVLQLSK